MGFTEQQCVRPVNTLGESHEYRLTEPSSSRFPGVLAAGDILALSASYDVKRYYW